jgi:hypothetical protein
MANCGNCPHGAATATPTPLFHIRRGYLAHWKDLAFLVETDAGDWKLSVLDGRRNTLYTAHRMNRRAAQLAAAEFAILRAPGAESSVTPERLAVELNWQPGGFATP